MKTFQLIICFIILFQQLPAQEAWLTDFDLAKQLALKEDRPIFLEVGSIDEFDVHFIDDKVWRNPLVVKALSDFIPVSIDLHEQRKKMESLGVKYYPTLLVYTADGLEIYRDYGYKTAEEIVQVLTYIQDTDFTETVDLARLYANDKSILGDLVQLEHYFLKVLRCPDYMYSFYRIQCMSSIDKLSKLEAKMNPYLKQRFNIIKYGFEYNRFQEFSRLNKLYAMTKEKVYRKNHGLLLFVLSVAEDIRTDRKKAVKIYQELLEKAKSGVPIQPYAQILEDWYKK